jgi:hypothetical protein
MSSMAISLIVFGVVFGGALLGMAFRIKPLCQNLVANKVTPVIGSVDKKTQRVALKIEGNNSLVVETGLYDLTNDEVPVLVHFDKDRQEERLMIRLSPPEASSDAK